MIDRSPNDLGMMIGIKLALWLVLLAPAYWLYEQFWVRFVFGLNNPGPFGSEPLEYIVRFSGEWGLRFLLLSLALTPLARRLNIRELILVRRLVGLFAFAYVSAHLMSYIWLLADERRTTILLVVLDRPYITLGLLGWMTLLLFAITSTLGWQRKPGRNWKRMDQVVYVSLIAGIVHLLWLTKEGFADAAVYTVIAALLLAERRYKGA